MVGEMKFERGRVYDIDYKCRDIGYGVEMGYRQLKFTGEVDTWGKLTLEAADGLEGPLYLFEDEILTAEPA